MNEGPTSTEQGQAADSMSSTTNQLKIKNSKRRNKKLLIAGVIVLILVAAGAIILIAYQHHSNKSASKTITSHESKALSSTSKASPSAIPLSIDPINPAAIPLGDGKVSTSPKVGYVDSCATIFSSGGGASSDGPWINQTNKTWNMDTKTAVEGSVSWPNAKYSVALSGNSRIITGNDLPINHTTGVFPISSSDPAYTYDQNPNTIEAQTINWTLPKDPTAASSPSCTSGGAIGILDDGVLLFNALDAEGRDAGAHEVLDSYQGHPDGGGMYHHHVVPTYMLGTSSDKSTSTLIGYAADGYGVYVERDSKGNLLTDSNLDSCHGRTSEVMWDGKMMDIYHYDVTLEYPYTIGCFHGSPVQTNTMSM